MALPSEIAAKMSKFSEVLKNVEQSIAKLTELNDESYSSLSPLDKADHDLTSVYTLLSLYWGLLRVQGVDPKTYEVKKDFDRVQESFKRVKELRDKPKAPHLDKGAAKRFVSNALWEPKGSEGSPLLKKIKEESK
ncbi:hypothetical protein QYM36_004737 [Artemia franciscana]|uniref:Nuclear nucleic acid-binding protein C1D n=2 Tax=Artemia franciscana TaxID=6661 RepID=A0AA88I855_ARTSF|nr:hypothetical protein QYM36_004102 [Artemia franciscana]KAK2720077.1 hypothetical protein QYM36_004102 [Artemia franciscana]KAK2720078.1 hypothetical protein QYM36_004102 [Artemia franciscana]KAK2720079.1 hypothetical protein QYM36_004102 [Artemia franciscana]KAK2720949.1 hypothetical protein QYM36_004737 [Artemia franciscana]